MMKKKVKLNVIEVGKTIETASRIYLNIENMNWSIIFSQDWKIFFSDAGTLFFPKLEHLFSRCWDIHFSQGWDIVFFSNYGTSFFPKAGTFFFPMVGSLIFPKNGIFIFPDLGKIECHIIDREISVKRLLQNSANYLWNEKRVSQYWAEEFLFILGRFIIPMLPHDIGILFQKLNVVPLSNTKMVPL